jgi:hypothetical protein
LWNLHWRRGESSEQNPSANDAQQDDKRQQGNGAAKASSTFSSVRKHIRSP